MITVTYTDNITKQLQGLTKEIKQLKVDGLAEFKDLTPIRSGNARNRTTLKGDTIVAEYAYAERLDNGWSKQAPNGMTQPFEKWLNKEVDKIFARNN